ncbi:MAG TPA: penicillin-binding protein 1A [Stenotrophobium sp.]|nr:penicillin-binding protein 1A [Stenotrophobium sp.]
MPAVPRLNKNGGAVLPWLLLATAVAVVAAVIAAFVVRASLEASLPSVQGIRQIQMSVPFRVYTRDGKLIGVFGSERRELLQYDDFPKQVVQAFVAAEDSNFFEHSGVDYWGLARAGLMLVVTGEKTQGGSTITMQLARNVFLSSKKTFTRKFREILLARKIEHELSKQEILALYLNKIYLGERAYGVGAAAHTYFGKDLKNLTLSEIAVLAGLPKAPSANNPVSNPKRATERRNYVLHRMLELHDITQQQYADALSEPVVTREEQVPVDVDAHYVAEMVRADLYARYGEALYTSGYSVITTIDSKRQQAADDALRKGLLEYDERHGWRGAEAKIDPALLDGAAARHKVELMLDARPTLAGLVPAVVLEFSPASLRLLTENGVATLDDKDFKWANLSAKKPLHRGDIVRIRRVGERWRLAQVPAVQGALVALDPKDGAVEALIGGYDFFAGKFNRATQAQRQVGSGFKPFLYAAALDKGYTPASVFLDSPVVFDDPRLESTWRPENDNGSFNGPMTLREALVHSRNLVSIRVLMAIGIDYARDYAARFGLAEDHMPKDLTLALGSASYTPMELARGYATIANGGYLVTPYYIDEIHDANGKVIFKAQPKVACETCVDAPAADPTVAASGTPPAAAPAPAPAAATTAGDATQMAPRVIDARTDWLLTSMMHDVTVRGTGAAARALGRDDLAGKTGTTNKSTDAWFNGFQKTLLAVSWVGFDQPASLGRGEYGASAALPIWMDFMRVALKGVPQEMLPQPPGLVGVRINPKTGLLASPGDPNAIFETVQADHIPAAEATPEATQQKHVVQDIF